jgi:GT2 family glycosyltransferase
MSKLQNESNSIEVSIVVVNWNTRELLLSCLRSLFQSPQGFSFEVIVSENGSCDGSEEAVRREFPAITVIQNGRDLGFGAGVNVGATRAKGRYIAVIPPDGTIPKDTLKRMLEYLISDRDVGVVGCRLVGPDGKTQLSCARFPTPLRVISLFSRLDRILPIPSVQTYYDRFDWRRGRTVPWDHLQSREVDTVLGAVFMMPIDAFRLVGGFDERYFMYYEEVDLFKMVRQKGFRVYFMTDVFAVHYGGEATKQEYAKMRFEQQRSLLIYIRKWHGEPSSETIRWFLIVLALLRYGVATLHSLKEAPEDSPQRKQRSAASSMLKGLLDAQLYQRSDTA